MSQYTNFQQQQMNQKGDYFPLYKSNHNKSINPLSLINKTATINQQKHSYPYSAQHPLQIDTNKTKLIHKGTVKLKKQHPKSYRTKMCPDGRQCRKRFTCTYAHTENQLKKPFHKRTQPCLLYQRGKCSLGSACRQYHGNMDLKKSYQYKVEMCKDYQQGKCNLGKLCVYKHGQFDNGVYNEHGDGQQKIQQKLGMIENYHNSEYAQGILEQQQQVQQVQQEQLIRIEQQDLNKKQDNKSRAQQQQKQKNKVTKIQITQLKNDKQPQIIQGGFSFTI